MRTSVHFFKKKSLNQKVADGSLVRWTILRRHLKRFYFELSKNLKFFVK